MLKLRHFALLPALFCPPATAQENLAPGICTLKSESEIIRILVCERDGSDDELEAEGRAACDGALPCGVWFYTDAAVAPDAAPANHDGLTQAQVVGALGVYAAEDRILVRIGRDATP